MKTINDPIKNKIIEAALPDVAFDGWTMDVLEQAAVKSGYAPEMARSVFPDGVGSAIAWFSQQADEAMIAALDLQNTQEARIRDKVSRAVWARLEFLTLHKEAVRLALSWWARPFNKAGAAKTLWRTADVIWDFAGDTSTDYNRYTKRSLLCGVLASTTLFWLNDTSPGHAESRAFLDRRIDNILSMGKIVGKLKKA